MMTDEKKTVLIVEDDAGMRQALHGRLEQDGLRVLAASSVDEGLLLLKQHTVALVLLDLKLGEKSGLQLMDAIHDDVEIDAEALDVVVLSAIADPAMMGEVCGRGTTDYLVKADSSLDEISVFIQKKL